MTEVRKLDATFLDMVCREMWGDDWIGPFSAALDVNERTVRRWRSNRDPIPVGVWSDLLKHVEEWRASIAAAAQALERYT